MRQETLLRLNRLAQEIEPMDRGLAWFEGLPERERRSTLSQLAMMILQSHPRTEDLPDLVSTSPVNRDVTAKVLLRKKPLKEALASIPQLPAAELSNSFLVLVAFFGDADKARRSRDCKNGCTHWWHQDLSDEDTIAA